MIDTRVPAYGWNAYAGRVWHRLTGHRHPGTNRPLTVCGAAVRGCADTTPAGYVECRDCARMSR